MTHLHAYVQDILLACLLKAVDPESVATLLDAAIQALDS